LDAGATVTAAGRCSPWTIRGRGAPAPGIIKEIEVVDPDEVVAFLARPRAPETTAALLVALEQSADWRKIGVQPCDCGCDSFLVLFEHRPSRRYIALGVEHHGEGHGTPRYRRPSWRREE
jgi:hypothetical protein